MNRKRKTLEKSTDKVKEETKEKQRKATTTINGSNEQMKENGGRDIKKAYRPKKYSQQKRK